MIELLDQTRLMTYFFVFIRTGGILFTAPVFGSAQLKPIVRVAITLILAATLYSFVPVVPFTGDVPTLFLVLQILKELLIGIAIGTLTSTLFTGVQMGGYLVDFQMGFSMVSVMDPETGGNFGFLSQVNNIMMLLIFIAVGGPMLIFQSIAFSFTILPPGNFDFNSNAFLFAVTLFAKIFVVAVTLMAPPIIVLMATNAAMGVMARIIPQINLLVVGFPIKIAVGLIIFAMSLQLFYVAFEKIMYNYFRHIREFIRLVGLE